MVIGEVDHGEGDALHLLAPSLSGRCIKSCIDQAKRKGGIEIGMSSFCAVQLLFSGKSKHLIRKINLIRLDWHFAIDRLIYFFLLSNDFDPFAVIIFPKHTYCMIQ